MQLYMYMFFCLHIWLVYYLHDIKSIHIPPKFHEYSIIFRQICPSLPSISVFPSRSFFLRLPRNLHGSLHVFSQVATTPASEVSVARAPVEAGHLGKNRTRKTGPVDPLESLETGDGDVQQRKP